MKKRIIIEIICGVIIFVVGFFIGDASAIKRVNAGINSNVEKKHEEKNKYVVEEKENRTEPKIYKLGEEGTSGNWSIKVLEATETNIIEAGNSADNKTTNDKFIVVKLQIKNISKSANKYSSNEFLLGDIKDKSQYKVHFDAMAAANNKESIYNKNNDFVGVYTDINPNTSKETYIIFEIPKDISLSDCVLINGNNGIEATGFYIN